MNSHWPAFCLLCTTFLSTPALSLDPDYLKQLEIEAENQNRVDTMEPENKSESALIQQVNTSIDEKKRRKALYLKQLDVEVNSNEAISVPVKMAPVNASSKNQTAGVAGSSHHLSLAEFETLIIQKQPTVLHFYNLLSTAEKKAVIWEYEENRSTAVTAKFILDLYSEKIKDRHSR
ncbi:MAG: hypothetical protein OEZ68_18885 [Gammaproteobacteria bacterium]|nr:hypothetical protein [Gammaproteobacteria bacterium]MDH5802873.1 hypothetical protein [Gammaproteobacteria bacterium]